MRYFALVGFVLLLTSCASDVGVGAAGGNSGMAIGIGSGISF
ncbi:hypothetical protein [Dryocola clanedunensis]|nr:MULTISPECIES: hypothetical protein [Enterobacteriaceae]